MSHGILLLRLVLGLTLAAHGAQKLFGAFGGGGPRGTAAFFAGLGFRAPLLMALAAGLAEFGGGLLLAVGLLTPVAALAIAVVMLNAIGTVQWRNGFWNTSRGYEYNALIWAVAVALAATGGARFSLDALIGWEGDLSGVWWGSPLSSAAPRCQLRRCWSAGRTARPSRRLPPTNRPVAGPHSKAPSGRRARHASAPSNPPPADVPVRVAAARRRWRIECCARVK
jgi:putative oxidoreductase